MIFGKIEYLNLLPFHVFMKRFTRSSQEKMSLRFHRGVPSSINEMFQKRRVDAAFVSSILARKFRHVDLGIVAKQRVKSVIVVPHAKNQKDSDSQSSNLLADILKVDGKVLIGDKALKEYLLGKEHVDLAALWREKYNLPFVFATLCYHKDQRRYKKMKTLFLKNRVKLPQYILKDTVRKSEFSQEEIQDYLSGISYEIDTKAKRSLKLFHKKAYFHQKGFKEL